MMGFGRTLLRLSAAMMAMGQLAFQNPEPRAYQAGPVVLVQADLNSGTLGELQALRPDIEDSIQVLGQKLERLNQTFDAVFSRLSPIFKKFGIRLAADGNIYAPAALDIAQYRFEVKAGHEQLLAIVAVVKLIEAHPARFRGDSSLPFERFSFGGRSSDRFLSQVLNPFPFDQPDSCMFTNSKSLCNKRSECRWTQGIYGLCEVRQKKK